MAIHLGWHGDNDSTVRPGAGDDLVNQWLNVHGIVGLPTEQCIANRHSRQVWRSLGGKSLVELHKIAGMAHGTPVSTMGLDGFGKSGNYLLEVGISSSREIIRSWNLSPSFVVQ